MPAATTETANGAAAAPFIPYRGISSKQRTTFTDKDTADTIRLDLTALRAQRRFVQDVRRAENAKDIAAWLQGDETFEDVLAASDARVDASSATK